MSHNHQTTRVVWILDRVIANLVLTTLGIMRVAHIAFKVFDHLDLNLTRFVEWRIFLKCDQGLVSWSHGVEPRLA
jgi:hypothetical protein